MNHNANPNRKLGFVSNFIEISTTCTEAPTSVCITTARPPASKPKSCHVHAPATKNHESKTHLNHEQQPWKLVAPSLPDLRALKRETNTSSPRATGSNIVSLADEPMEQHQILYCTYSSPKHEFKGRPTRKP